MWKSPIRASSSLKLRSILSISMAFLTKELDLPDEPAFVDSFFLDFCKDSLNYTVTLIGVT